MKHSLSVFFLVYVKNSLYLVTDEKINSKAIYIHGSEYYLTNLGYLSENPEYRTELEEEILLRIAENNRNCFLVINHKKDFLKPKIYKAI